MKCTIVIHGGAGVISKETDPNPYYDALKRIISTSYQFAVELDGKCSPVDVVEFAVKLLEDEPLFNAGRGAVLTADGTHELEASIMDGVTLKCGAVSKVNNVKNPVSLARAVMERTKHNYLVGDDVLNKLADEAQLDKVDSSYFTTERRVQQLQMAIQQAGIFLDHSLHIASDQSHHLNSLDTSENSSSVFEDQPGGTGTVGCVCMLNGQVAAATSTGGLTNKLSGRIGDTPITGAGNYAHHLTGAFSGTGTGEDFMRHVATHDAHCRMLYGGSTLHEAVQQTVFNVLPNDCGGIIAVDSSGAYTMPFNTLGMFRAVATSQVHQQVGILEELMSIIP